MKKYILLSLACLLTLSSCYKEPVYEEDGIVHGKRKVGMWVRSPKSTRWQASDMIGVFCADESNIKFTVDKLAEGKTQLGYFQGPLTAGTTIQAAYYPYKSSAGTDATKIPVVVQNKASYGTSPARFDVATYQKGQDVPLVFQKKLSTLKLTFDNVDQAWCQDQVLKSIKIKGARAMVGNYTADLSSVSAPLTAVQASNEVVVDMRKEKLVTSLAVSVAMAPTWRTGDIVEVTVSRNIESGDPVGDLKKVNVTLTADAVEGEELPISVDAREMAPVLPTLTLEWASPVLGLEDGASASQFSGNYPAVDQNGNVYVQMSVGTDRIYKLNAATGTIAWSEHLGVSESVNPSPSCEPDGSVIYASGGRSGTGRVVAYNGNGGIKWDFSPDKFFSGANAPAPNFNFVTPVVGQSCIYVGNGGTTGSVLSINKSTGNRVAYVCGADNVKDEQGKVIGTNVNPAVGPTGGVNTGLALAKNGVVGWGASYGLFGASQAALDAPTLTSTYGHYVPFGLRVGPNWNGGNPWWRANMGVACANVDGKDCFVFSTIEKTSNGTFNMHITWQESAGGLGASAPYLTQNWLKKVVITDVADQDQGGLVIGPQGEAIVALKINPGTGEGGIAAYLPNGDPAYTFSVGQLDVAGAAAVDNQGYIHVVADKVEGSTTPQYFILKPSINSQSCSVVASANLWQLMKNAGCADMGDSDNIRAWTSVVIGSNGKMYLAVTQRKGTGEQKARILCLSYSGVTGPSTASPWPQRSGDCYNTGRAQY